ncbi:hypothetical protein Hanom_Chr13g01206531 [Helianthus anomalus]
MLYTKSCEGTFIIIFNRNSYTLLLLLLMTNNQKFGDGVEQRFFILKKQPCRSACFPIS